MYDRTEKDHGKLGFDHSDRSGMISIRVKDDQCIDPLALSQVKVSVALRSGFDGFNQKFVTSSVADATNAKHQGRSERVNAHQVSVSEYQPEGPAPSTDQHTRGRVRDVTQCLCRFEYTRLSFSADVGSGLLIQDERDGGTRHSGGLSNVVARYPPRRFHSS